MSESTTKNLTAIKNKKQRFIYFLDKTLESASEELIEKLETTKNIRYPLTLKFVVKDIRYLRYIVISESGFKLHKKKLHDKRIDSYMSFNTAKVVHYLLSGKILPLNASLIGKVKFLYLNQSARLFSMIYNPAKNNYMKIIKGTRFTLKQ